MRRSGLYAAGVMLVLPVLASAKVSLCNAPPFGDLPERYSAYAMGGPFKPRGLLSDACHAKFDHRNRQTFYEVGIVDDEIDSLSPVELANHYLDIAGNKALDAQIKHITITDFILDGKDLASQNAPISLTGIYKLEGRVGLLYATQLAALTAGQYGGGESQQAIDLLTDDASRDLRRKLLSCQTNPSTAQLGCQLTVRGFATVCTETNAFGTPHNLPCLRVVDGR